LNLGSPAGGKLWRLKYRFLGKEKRLSLGSYPEVSLKDARERRDSARKQLGAGVDPGVSRKVEREAKRRAKQSALENVAKEWLSHRSTAWKAGTLDAIRSSLENHIFPTLGPRHVDEIEPHRIREAVQAIECRGTAETAGRVFQRLRSIYRYAIAYGFTKGDRPTR
jgi:hypothetical protein